MRQSCLMTEELQDIKTLIEQGDTERAIHALTNFIRNDAHVNDEPYYLLGNAYRKNGKLATSFEQLFGSHRA